MKKLFCWKFSSDSDSVFNFLKIFIFRRVMALLKINFFFHLDWIKNSEHTKKISLQYILGMLMIFKNIDIIDISIKKKISILI